MTKEVRQILSITVTFKRMFRGGEYVDQPKFYNNESMPKNSLDVSVSLFNLLMMS